MLMLNIPSSNFSPNIFYTHYSVVIFLCVSTHILGWNFDVLARYFSLNTADFYELRSSSLNLLNPTGHVMHQQCNIQQLYALPTLYLCVLYLSENKQRLVPLTAKIDWFL